LRRPFFGVRVKNLLPDCESLAIILHTWWHFWDLFVRCSIVKSWRQKLRATRVACCQQSELVGFVNPIGFDFRRLVSLEGPSSNSEKGWLILLPALWSISMTDGTSFSPLAVTLRWLEKSFLRFGYIVSVAGICFGGFRLRGLPPPRVGGSPPPRSRGCGSWSRRGGWRFIGLQSGFRGLWSRNSSNEILRVLDVLVAILLRGIRAGLVSGGRVRGEQCFHQWGKISGDLRMRATSSWGRIKAFLFRCS
jgi:hypothetical protein